MLRKRDSILFLLGAGASHNAGIPISAEMIKSLEDLISDDNNKDFSQFYSLYYYIRSAINYGNDIRKINKQSQAETVYNIENLVISLDELAKKDEHHLYPFIGAWNPKLTEVTDKDFLSIKDFRDRIVDKVRDWVDIKREEKTDYYQGLISFYEEYEHPLRIFSLNYDLCVETACKKVRGTYPERGFYPRRYSGDEKVARTWNWQLLDESVIDNESTPILLYKLHGSVDWERHADGKLTFEDSINNIESKNTAIIFGTSYKLQYYDPFLYLFQEFRKWSLKAKLIVCIGYGFVDEHVNGILGQALNNESEMKLLCVSPVFGDDDKKEEIKSKEVSKIEDALRLNQSIDTRIIRWDMTAEEFMTNRLKMDDLIALFPHEEELLPEVKLEAVDDSQKSAAVNGAKSVIGG